MLILRIRQAQCALADGRLDEAFDLTQAQDVRRHRRGQGLIGRLLRALVRRGRQHLQASRLAMALADCQKAAHLGGNTAEVADLRSDVAQAMTDQQQQARRRGELLSEAREHIDNGRLSMGQLVLAESDQQTAQVVALGQEVAHRRDAAESATKKIQAALDRNDLSAAIDELLAAQHAGLAGSRLNELTGRVTKVATDRAWDNINDGRLDLTEALMERLAPLARRDGQMHELAKVLSQCSQAGRLIEANRPQEAGRVLRRLRSILPDVGWLADALRSCSTAADAMEALRSGALAMLGADGQAGDPTDQPEDCDIAPALLRQSPPRQPSGPPLPDKFLIQADDVGSFLVVRGPAVTVGPISSAERPDIGLIANPDLPAVSIERHDEDYFLRCGQPVMVNDKPVTEKLLCDGDRIALSPRCRWRFLRPNAASTSVVLAFSGAQLGQADTRKVILLDREIVMGPGPTAHIRADQADCQAVLHVKDGRLLCRTEAAVTADGRPIGPGDSIAMSVPIRIGQVSLVLTPA